MIYVRFEPISTAYVTMGIDPIDSLNSANPVPRHIMLLPPVTDDLTINQHTGFNVIDGQDQVRNFLSSDRGRQAAWLDYREEGFVDDLLPQEIAELLYLGHKKAQMVLPFYYKLQNEYARVPLKTGLVNSYWRHPERFATVFAVAMNRHLKDVLAQRPFWFRVRNHIGAQKTPPAVQKQLEQLFPDGVVFDWPNAVINPKVVEVPMLRLPERQLYADMNPDTLGGEELGKLVLDRRSEQWRVEMTK